MTERTELTRDDCLRLLRAKELGRGVFTAAAMPAVQPVSYVLHGDEVVFRVTDGGALSTATRHAVVGFHVDDIDPVTLAGWTVLGVGLAHAEDADTDPATHSVTVPLLHLTGHRVQLADGGPQSL